MGDLESEPTWLKKVRELNAVILATGEPLVGNLFYDHLQTDYLTRPPNPILRFKRDRFRNVTTGRTRLLEIGVNGGHSAFLALTSDPAIEYHGVDICEHAYVKPAVSWLKREFPGRVFFYEGDCRAILPKLVRDGWRFDAFHIDGAKFTYFEDIRNCQRMIAGEAVVVVDDSQQEYVSRVLRRCASQGRIRALSEFPPMPTSVQYRNQIGQLEPASAWQNAMFRLLMPARRLQWSAWVQRLDVTLPRLTQQAARRARAVARHPVMLVRRRMPYRRVEP